MDHLSFEFIPIFEDYEQYSHMDVGKRVYVSVLELELKKLLKFMFMFGILITRNLLR